MSTKQVTYCNLCKKTDILMHSFDVKVAMTPKGEDGPWQPIYQRADLCLDCLPIIFDRFYSQYLTVDQGNALFEYFENYEHMGKLIKESTEDLLDRMFGEETNIKEI